MEMIKEYRYGYYFENYYDVFEEGDGYCFHVDGGIWFDDVGNILQNEMDKKLNDCRTKFLSSVGEKKVFKGLKRKNEIK